MPACSFRQSLQPGAELSALGSQFQTAYQQRARGVSGALTVCKVGGARLPAEDVRVQAVGTLALCVGGLLLARATLDRELSDDILDSCRQFAANAEETVKHDH